ncbi:uncharacterized protein LOC122867471 [Siniperca chuatsi]|uniref:uncharacterized protein LOC122867471 n=1 Tax=Siniperca chuatsi TaxID=119488 RepID=UPI001CE190F0|nr:uncharacterized protein LOC122867471 [Siniperca chuatsi]
MWATSTGRCSCPCLQSPRGTDFCPWRQDWCGGIRTPERPLLRFCTWTGTAVALQDSARVVTTDSHQLYGLFMARLSFAIFEWDSGDVDRLTEAKQSEEGRDAHITLSARELARHCRRRTRGAQETERLIQEVLDSFWAAADTMGVPLIDRARMEEIWSTQCRHLHCIQDPPGVELYAKKGEVTGGGVRLPVFRCARGSTSLESFHLHLCRFIPGTSANALHFQVYLLEGLVRWNENRARASVEGAQRTTLRCYSAQLQHSFNQLTQEFLGLTLVENYTQPGEYTGELIGVEYLYFQTGAVLQEDVGRDPDAPDGTDGAEDVWEDEYDEDKGFQEELADMRFADNLSSLLRPSQPQPQPLTPPSSSQSGPAAPEPMEMEEEEEEEDLQVGPFTTRPHARDGQCETCLPWAGRRSGTLSKSQQDCGGCVFGAVPHTLQGSYLGRDASHPLGGCQEGLLSHQRQRSQQQRPLGSCPHQVV